MNQMVAWMFFLSFSFCSFSTFVIRTQTSLEIQKLSMFTIFLVYSVGMWTSSELFSEYRNHVLKNGQNSVISLCYISVLHLFSHLLSMHFFAVLFDNYIQQDAHEFLNYLLNHIADLLDGEPWLHAKNALIQKACFPFFFSFSFLFFFFLNAQDSDVHILRCAPGCSRTLINH